MQELLPLTYSFHVDLGDGGDDFLLRDAQHASNHASFLLPSSRATIKDQHFGWILCRVNCPVTLIAEVKDLHNTASRWTTTLRLHRPGCPDKVSPCINSIMLDIVDTSLRSVDVFAADHQPVNAMMLLLGVELSDLDIFSVNATLGAAPSYNTMRTKDSRRIESTQQSTRLQDNNLKDSTSKAAREKEQDRMRQRFVPSLLLQSLVSFDLEDFPSPCQRTSLPSETLCSGLTKYVGRRMESLAILRDLETQGLYKALHEDLADALDVSVSAFDVRSGTETAAQQQSEQSEDFDTILNIDQHP